MPQSSNKVTFTTVIDKQKRLEHEVGLLEWQLAHIEKGVEAARRGDIATESEVEEFVGKYGRFS
ncbi:MAG: hypothetical protein RIG61_10880 [Deltaproteobacteria bacterium]